jgi:hypothetical protein
LVACGSAPEGGGDPTPRCSGAIGMQPCWLMN